jgi:HrpA-like RNA helicase
MLGDFRTLHSQLPWRQSAVSFQRHCKQRNRSLNTLTLFDFFRAILRLLHLISRITTMASSNSSDINPYTDKPFSASYEVLRKQTESLPVFKHLPELIDAVRENQVVIVVGETGSGKSTVLPKEIMSQLLGDAGMLALTQPRRLAASRVADRIAASVDMPVGEVVGLRYRGCNSTTLRTRLVVLTDGMSNVLYLDTLLLTSIRITGAVSHVRPYPVRLHSHCHR